MSERKMIILTEGHSNPHTAKTGCSILRYRPEEVVAVLDGTLEGQDVPEYLGVGEGLKFVGSIDDAQSGLTTGRRYYVHADGSLETYASVFLPDAYAGLATSATKILVKG